MNYSAPVLDFFRSPKCMMNLLLAGACCLVPILGWVVVTGWLVTGFWSRTDENPETFPDFDFNQLGKYFERGLWPCIVALAIGACGSLIIQITSGLLLGAIHMVVGKSGLVASTFGIVFGLIFLVFKVALMFATTPIVIRATIMQDFVKAFDIPYVKKFVSLMWLETLLTVLTLIVASLVLIPLGMVIFCVGICFSMALLLFASAHLNKQLYLLYLSRGGEAIPLSPKLTDSVPPIPPAPPAAV